MARRSSALFSSELDRHALLCDSCELRLHGGEGTYDSWYSWISPTGYKLFEKKVETGTRGGSDWVAWACAEVPSTSVEGAFFFFLGFFFSARRKGRVRPAD
jgi:hypothetical protein